MTAIFDVDEIFRLAFEAAPNAILWVNREGIIQLVNGQLEKDFGYSREELLGQAVELLVPERTRPVHSQYRDSFFADPQVRALGAGRDLYGQRKDGSQFPIEIGLNPVTLNGETTVLAAIIDITKRKRAEEELQALNESLESRVEQRTTELETRTQELAGANEQLARERNLLTTLVENMPDAIYFKDRESRFIRANPGACKIFGVDAEGAVLGKTDAAFFNSAEADEYLSDEQRIIRTGEPLIGKEEYERWQDGQMYWVLTTKMPLYDDQGNVEGTFGISRDITKQKQAEDALARANEELRRSNVDLQQFAYVASHDLQEPLRSITGFSQLLMRSLGDKLDNQEREYLSDVIDGSKRMQALIKDLLAYSRVQRDSIKFAPTDMNQVVEQAKGSLKTAIDDSRAYIKYEELATIQADKTQMVQLVQNLLGNAVKYRGDAVPQIHMGGTESESEWTFFVKDNGIGVDPKRKDRIFLLFQRLHPRDEYDGTGLGLAICKRIVERHGGQIWVESQPNNGATFFFTIPKDQ